MQKPKQTSPASRISRLQLPSPAWFGNEYFRTESLRDGTSIVAAASVNHNDLARRLLKRQVLQVFEQYGEDFGFVQRGNYYA